MAESSDDPLSILPNHGLTPLRKAVPEHRRSNPFYIPTDERFGSVQEEESSDPTLLKPAPRVTPTSRRVLLQGMNPRTPQVPTDTRAKRWIAVRDAVAEEGDTTLRPNINPHVEEEQGADTSAAQDGTTLNEDSVMQEFWNPTAAEGEFEMNHEMNDEEGVGSEILEQDEDYLENDDEDIELLLSEGEFQPHTSDDEMAFRMKSDDEQEEIREEIQELLEKIPELGQNYELVDRLGTGTFSSVFKAIDIHYDSFDNRLWEGPQSSASDPAFPGMQVGKHVYVAIKRIIVTSSPRRILNELDIMEACRGCRHVAQIITAYRVEDQIVAVMPYQRSAELKDLMRTLDIYGVRQYFRCMFRALRDIHARGIIHRDLKPANFLFDPIENTGTMVDFGLAEEFEFIEEKDSGCLHTAPTVDMIHGEMKDNPKWINYKRKSIKVSRDKSELPPESIGWPTDDTRLMLKANRAGTRGFRAPEVLFKCVFQSPAIDIWSAGTILLFFLTGKAPIFTASSDMHALLEQALILGKATMEECAALHCRTFATNIPEIQDRTSWIDFVKRLNPDLLPEEPISSPPRSVEDMEEGQRRRLVALACGLLEKCLDPMSVTRVTARDALYHPFLAPDLDELLAAQAADPPIELDEDELFPHPPGEGVCRQHHHITKARDGFVFVGYDEKGEEEWEHIEAGQGQAIGTKPCEFHEDFFYN